MNKIIIPVLASILILGVMGFSQAASAIVIEFEECVNGSPSYTEDGALVTPLGGSSLFCVNTPNGTIGAIGENGGPKRFVPLQTDLGCITNFVSADVGDFGREGLDSDIVYLEAYTVDDVLVDEVSVFTPGTLNALVTLSVSGENISYILTGTRDTFDSVFTDNVTFECVLSPVEQIQNMIEQVSDLALPESVTTSLSGLLNNAISLLEDGVPQNDAAVCGKLTAFLNEVDAKEGNGQLTFVQADQLRVSAQTVLEDLGC